jgi:IclR family KDG regulon transcriptional repressor
MGYSGGEQMSSNNAALSLTVIKALSILDHLGHASGPLSAMEISRQLGIPRATVHRLASTLVVAGYAKVDGDSPERFSLGLRTLELAGGFLGGLELRQVASPILSQLRDLSNETIHMVIVDEGQVVYVAKEDSHHPVRMHSALGRRGFMHSSAVGKAVLAFLPESEVEAIIDAHGLPALTPNTITDRGELWKELDRVRKLGYAIDDIENEESIRCVGAPIFDYTGTPIAAISISGPAFRLSRQRIQELVEPLTSAAQDISRRLGHSTR